MAIDASGAPAIYRRTFSRVARIHKARLVIETKGVARPSWNLFGDVGALALGIIPGIWRSIVAVEQPLYIDDFIKFNADFARMGWSQEITDYGAGGVRDVLTYEFNLQESFPDMTRSPREILLDGDTEGLEINTTGFFFGIGLLDDLTGLQSMTCEISGEYLGAGSEI
jgi:hypothetical protein